MYLFGSRIRLRLIRSFVACWNINSESPEIFHTKFGNDVSRCSRSHVFFGYVLSLAMTGVFSYVVVLNLWVSLSLCRISQLAQSAELLRRLHERAGPQEGHDAARAAPSSPSAKNQRGRGAPSSPSAKADTGRGAPSVSSVLSPLHDGTGDLLNLSEMLCRGFGKHPALQTQKAGHRRVPTQPAQTVPVYRDEDLLPNHRLALCIHGSARTLGHRLIYQSLRENLIDALGASTTVFFHVTRRDMRGDMRRDPLGTGGGDMGSTMVLDTKSKDSPTMRDYSLEDLKSVARFLGVTLTDNFFRVLEGPTTPHMPKCQFPLSDPKGPAIGSMIAISSLAGQLNHRNGCMDMIEREEFASGKKFDSVLLLRGDVLVYQSFRPWCTYDFSRLPLRKWDWLFWLPGTAKNSEITHKIVRKAYEDFFNCKIDREGFKTDKGLEDWQELVKGKFDVEKWERPYVYDTVTENRDFPVLLTRLPVGNMPHNMCDSSTLKFGGGAGVAVGEGYCREFSSGNAWNVRMEPPAVRDKEEPPPPGE